MATATYAGLKERNEITDFGLSPTTGGATTQPTSFYYFAYGIARGGINLGTALGQVAIASGEKLQFIINQSARTEGIHPFGFAIAASPTNDEAQAKLLAIAWIIDADQVTELDLPITLELTTDEDFIIDGTIETIADLPNNPVNGCIRFVNDDSNFYQWDGEGWYGTPSWRQVYGNQTYLPNSTTLRSGLKWKGGCHSPIITIPPDPSPNYYGVVSPPWGGDGDTSPPIKLWLLNGLSEGTGAVLPIDSQISLVALVNDSSELGAAVLSGKIALTVTGIVRRLNGELQVLDVSSAWNSGTPFYFLQSQLDRGYALEVEYTCSAVVGDGDTVTVYLKDDGVFGVPTTAIFLGNSVFANDNKAMIVPDTLGVKRLSGKGLVITSGQNLGHFFNCNGTSGLTQGILADTANQQIAISGIRNGAIAVRQSGEVLQSTEAVRAIISTEPGTATASDWSNPVTVGANGRIEVAIALPNSIRSDYPDSLIAGNSDAMRAIPQMRVFVRVAGVITELDAVVVEADDDQLLVIGTLSNGVVVESVESNGDAEFNLWGYESITPVATGVGSLAAGDYEIAIAWDYPSPNLGITKITHDINEVPSPGVSPGVYERREGCMPTLALSFADAIALANIYSQLQVQGVDQAQRKILDINSRLVETEDDPVNDRLIIRLPELGRTIVTNRDPEDTDDLDNGYRLGDLWLNSSSDPIRLRFAQSLSSGTAVWPLLGEGAGGNGIEAIADLATLKALTSDSHDATYLLKSTNNIYRYDADSTATGNDNTVIEPDMLPGRFLKVGTYGAAEITETDDKQFLSLLERQAIVANTDALANKSDVGHEHLANQGSLLTHDGVDQSELLVGNEGQMLTPDSNGSLVWVDPPNTATTTTTAGYVQPNLEGTVVINVGSTANFIEGVSWVAIASGGNYLVTQVNTATTLTVQYKGGGATPTTSISTNKKVSPTGASGTDGLSSLTTTTADFIVPAVNSTAVVLVAQSGGFNLGVSVHIESAGSYEVTAINPDSITVLNLGGNNTVAGANIASGSQVVITGPPGLDGSVEATSSLNFTTAVPPPSTGVEEWKGFIDSTNNNRRSLREPGDGAVNVFAFLNDILPTPLTGFVESTLTAIVDTDTILEAFGKVQKYLTDYLTNFNGNNQLVKLENDGLLPKLVAHKLSDYALQNVNVSVVADGTYRIFIYPSHIDENIRWDGIYDLLCDSNGGTISITINGTVITGFDTLTVNQTGTNYTATGNNVLNPGSNVYMVLTNDDPNNPITNLSFCLYGIKNP